MVDYILGVEIGGTKLQLALGNPQGEVFDILQGEVTPEKGAQGILGWIETHLPEMVSRAQDRGGQVTRIGCGFGGPLDSSRGKILTSVQIQGWEDFPLASWFEETFGFPTFLANDSNAAAYGEFKRGVGQGSQNFFYTNIGSGVGGGLVINGELYDGQGFGAGEFGQSYVPDWSSDQPGKPEKIENLCSGWAIEERLRKKGYVPESSLIYKRCEGDISSLHARALGQAAQDGDSFALKEIDRIAFSMSLGITNVLCLFNPEVIAIGGGVSKIGELLLEPIREYTRKYEFISSVGHYKIQRSILGDEIVLVGAILLAVAEPES